MAAPSYSGPAGSTHQLDSVSKSKIEKAHSRLAHFITKLANEPALGLWHVQNHIHGSLPKLVEMKKDVQKRTQLVEGLKLDTEYSHSTVKVMGTLTPSFENTKKQLQSSMATLDLLIKLYTPGSRPAYATSPPAPQSPLLASPIPPSPKTVSAPATPLASPSPAPPPAHADTRSAPSPPPAPSESPSSPPPPPTASSSAPLPPPVDLSLAPQQPPAAPSPLSSSPSSVHSISPWAGPTPPPSTPLSVSSPTSPAPTSPDVSPPHSLHTT